MISKRERMEMRAWDLAQRVASMAEETDPYGFRDVMNTGETMHEALERFAGMAYEMLMTGRKEEILEMFWDDDYSEVDFASAGDYERARRLARDVRRFRLEDRRRQEGGGPQGDRLRDSQAGGEEAPQGI